jgi:hypothetical protein
MTSTGLTVLLDIVASKQVSCHLPRRVKTRALGVHHDDPIQFPTSTPFQHGWESVKGSKFERGNLKHFFIS